MKFPKLHSSAFPKEKRSSAQKKLIALKINTKRLQRRAWVLEKHLSHTTRNEKREFRTSKSWYDQPLT